MCLFNHPATGRTSKIHAHEKPATQKVMPPNPKNRNVLFLVKAPFALDQMINTQTLDLMGKLGVTTYSYYEKDGGALFYMRSEKVMLRSEWEPIEKAAQWKLYMFLSTSVNYKFHMDPNYAKFSREIHANTVDLPKRSSVADIEMSDDAIDRACEGIEFMEDIFGMEEAETVSAGTEPGEGGLTRESLEFLSGWDFYDDFVGHPEAQPTTETPAVKSKVQLTTKAQRKDVCQRPRVVLADVDVDML